jgi:PAS domain S-box-containing protein
VKTKNTTSTLKGIAAAILSPLVIAAILQQTWPFFEQTPVSPFLIAVTFCAWYAGLRSGLLSMALSCLIVDYFFIQPYFALWPPHRRDLVFLITLAGVGTFASILSELMRRAQRDAEKNLEDTRVSEEMFRSLVTATSQMVWITDGEGRAISPAPAWNEITGRNLDDTTANGWVEALHDEDRQRFNDLWEEAKHQQQPYEAEVRIFQRDHQYHCYSIRGVPIRDAEGRCVRRWIHSGTNISGRKLADERFRLVVEALPSSMIVANSEGHITLVNTQTENLFGYARSELLGQPVEMLVPQRFRLNHFSYRSDFLANPVARPMGAGRDLYGLRKDGSEFPIEIGLSPLQTDQGTMVLASIVDIADRKHTESLLRRQVNLLEQTHDAVFVWQPGGVITYWNRAAEELYGYSREEAVGRTSHHLLQTIHPQATTEFEKSLQREGEWSGELKHTVRDGREIIVESRHVLVRDPDGQEFVLETNRDITSRKQAEERLRRSQEQLAGIIGSAMDAVITVDDNQRVILFNGAAERMFLFPAEDAIGQPLDRFIPERFRAAHGQHVRGFGTTHVTRRSMGALGALYGLRADGEEFPIEASISQIESDERKLFTVILRDISERKRAEEALKEQARILDLAPVLIRDLNGRILFWNTGAQQMYGWSAEEALEKFTHGLFKTEFPRPEEEIKARLLARGHWEGELIHTTKDGRRLVIDSHWVLHRDEHDKPRAILEVNTDITERKQAEREIRRLNEELEQRVANRTAQLQTANKELEAFSYSVSHDLRAPLRHIDGFSQALLEDYADQLDEVARSYLKQVRGATQEMARLIDDLLQLARVSRGELRREEVNLSEQARSVVEELKKANLERNVTITIGDGLKTRGDRRLLRVVLTNLLGNAWKFTSNREEAEVSFGQARQNGESTFFVRDNGAGFDMTYAKKLFGAFQRLHTADEFEGTGIGLATVQRIVSRHGGRVWAESKVNEGATFYFTLPNSRETGDEQQSDSAGGRQSER